MQWRSISTARASRSPCERAASGPASLIAGPDHISSHRGRASAPASYAKQFGVEALSWHRWALGLDRGGDCQVYGTSIWRSSVSRADEIGGRRQTWGYLRRAHHKETAIPHRTEIAISRPYKSVCRCRNEGRFQIFNPQSPDRRRVETPV